MTVFGKPGGDHIEDTRNQQIATILYIPLAHFIPEMGIGIPEY